MDLTEIKIFLSGSIGIIAFIALAGFTEGCNYPGAIISMMIMAISVKIALDLDRKSNKKR